jgi:hypothetical protein
MYTELASCGASQSLVQSSASSFDTLSKTKEVNVMNSHLHEIFNSEKSIDIIHSVELFAGIIAAACLVGLACIAVL